MNTYIALFRGINIGGHHRLPMKELVGILQDMGYLNIKTYIQSGNVVFLSKNKSRSAIARDISQKIVEHYDFEPKVFLLDEIELGDAIRNNPFDTSDGKAVHIFFLESPAKTPNLDKLTELKSESEQFKLNGTLFYLFTPEGVGRSKLAANVEKCLGVPTTARNWNTVNRILAMVKQT